VYVVTGPLYLPTQTPHGYAMQYPLIGEKQFWVTSGTETLRTILMGFTHTLAFPPPLTGRGWSWCWRDMKRWSVQVECLETHCKVP
jgi:hypothetical protein